jgi:hypothetical protein
VRGDLCVILDRFEEYFLYHAQEDGQGTFGVEFPRAASHPDLRVNFLISIREDSPAKLDRFKGSIANLFADYLRMDIPTARPRAAIEKPLDQYLQAQRWLQSQPWAYFRNLSTGEDYLLKDEIVSIGRTANWWHNQIGLPWNTVSRTHLLSSREVGVLDQT